MGRSKRGFNSKARGKVEGHLTDENQVQRLQEKVHISSKDDEDYGGRKTEDSNALVLPGRKRKFKKADDPEGADKTKLLSRYFTYLINFLKDPC